MVTPLFLRVLYWLSFVAAVTCTMIGVVRNTEVYGQDATGLAEAPFYPGLALVTWLVVATYAALVIAWLRAPAAARGKEAGVRTARMVFDGGLGVVLCAIVTVALTSNDPGDPGILVLGVRWLPALLMLALMLVAGLGSARAGRDAPATHGVDQEGLA